MKYGQHLSAQRGRKEEMDDSSMKGSGAEETVREYRKYCSHTMERISMVYEHVTRLTFLQPLTVHARTEGAVGAFFASPAGGPAPTRA